MSTSPTDAVGVALASYRGASWIREQLQSILAQTSPVAEIVVSDDGSDDATLEVATEALASARARGIRVQLVTNPGHSGVVGNFSHALSLLSSPLVALSDQDDVWHPQKVARLREALAGRPAARLVHTDARLVDAGGAPTGSTLFQAVGVGRRELGEIHSGRGFEALLRRNLATGATMMLRRELLDLALPVPEGWIHDEWLAIVAAATGGLEVREEALVDYRQHEGNEIGARVLSLGGKARRMGEPRAARNARLLLRAEALPARLADLGVEPRLITLAERKLAHERRRSGLPRSRLARTPEVLHGVVVGDYRRFGRGLLDAARDMVQPA